MDYDTVQQHQESRKDQQHRKHADQRAAGEKVAHGTNQINIRIHTHAEGGGEEAQSADQNRRHGVGQRLRYAGLFVVIQAQFLIPGGHQNGVVHGGAQLDGADADGRDKGHGKAGVIG